MKVGKLDSSAHVLQTTQNGWVRLHVYMPHSSSISIDAKIYEQALRKIGLIKVKQIIKAELAKPKQLGVTRSRQVSNALFQVCLEPDIKQDIVLPV